MLNNDIKLLDYKLNQRKVESEISLTESEIFEIFSFEQILKNYDLSYDQLQTGLVDNGDDGGIDGFFVFLNGELLDEDFEISTGTLALRLKEHRMFEFQQCFFLLRSEFLLRRPRLLLLRRL